MPGPFSDRLTKPGRAGLDLALPARSPVLRRKPAAIGAPPRPKWTKIHGSRRCLRLLVRPARARRGTGRGKASESDARSSGDSHRAANPTATAPSSPPEPRARAANPTATAPSSSSEPRARGVRSTSVGPPKATAKNLPPIEFRVTSNTLPFAGCTECSLTQPVTLPLPLDPTWPKPSAFIPGPKRSPNGV